MILEHKDKLDRILLLGDCVAYPHRNCLQIGIIVKLNPIMIKIVQIGAKNYENLGVNKYPKDIIKVDGPDVSMYLLKQSK
jgi:hypothetical protein